MKVDARVVEPEQPAQLVSASSATATFTSCLPARSRSSPRATTGANEIWLSSSSGLLRMIKNVPAAIIATPPIAT
jgi:hypothetical protein